MSIIICADCGEVAKYREADERMTPYMEDGYYECMNPDCENTNITDGTPDSNMLNGYTTIFDNA